MKELLIFVSVMSCLLPIGYFTLKWFFKGSIIFLLSWFNLLIIYFSSILYFSVGILGIMHLFWAIPVASILTGVLFFIIKRKVQQPLLFAVDHLNNIAEGDLNIANVKEMESQSNELGLLNENIQKLVFVLKHLVKEVNKSSRKLSKSSKQLAENTRNMAKDSTQHANSSELLSVNMEEIASAVATNADNAKMGNVLAQNNKDSLSELFELSSHITKVVDEIASKSEEIDGIAKHTNILALNAAVEAAKSGEAGRGFAVVASEVRRLAEYTTNTAMDIGKLSNESKELVAKSSYLFEEMLPQIEKSSDMVADITSASHHQKESLNNVNDTIKDLNQVTQRNVLTAEDIAVTSEQLQMLSERLKDSLQFFKVSDDSIKERMQKARKLKKPVEIQTSVEEERTELVDA